MNDEASEKPKDKYQKLIEEIKKERDEIHLKAHLIRSEVRDEWEELEEKWQNLRLKSKRAKREAKDASSDVWNATKFLGEEIKEGYKRIRKSF